jgi:hypothetical protein
MAQFPLSQAPVADRLCTLIPPWQRLLGIFNTQHSTHDFPLDIHTHYVVAGTNEASQTLGLSPTQASMARWAAWLHDIAKTGGMPEAKAQTPVDKHHPWKSAVMAQWMLIRLGFPPVWVERVTRLIQFHQLFGAMVIRNAPWGAVPTPLEIRHAQWAVHHPNDLPMLTALTEGDIRGVKAQGQLFDDRVRYKLYSFTSFVADSFAREAKPYHGWHMPHATLCPDAMTTLGRNALNDPTHRTPYLLETLTPTSDHGGWWMSPEVLVQEASLDDCGCGATNLQHGGSVTGFGYQQRANTLTETLLHTPIPQRPHVTVHLARKHQLPQETTPYPFWLWVTSGAESMTWHPHDVSHKAPTALARMAEVSQLQKDTWYDHDLQILTPQALQRVASGTPLGATPTSLVDADSDPPWLGMDTTWWLAHTQIRTIQVQQPWVIGLGTTKEKLPEARRVWEKLLAQRGMQGLRNDRLRHLPWVLVTA